MGNYSINRSYLSLLLYESMKTERYTSSKITPCRVLLSENDRLQGTLQKLRRQRVLYV